MGAFLALRAKNRAFRCKSSEAPMRFLWAFRYNPLRSGSSETGHAIAFGNCVGNSLPKAMRRG
ncbi:MAG: hypothetical protein LBK44_02380 [Spirochaetales bacterium]|jgi:hypothetical protein|nr:hypothetical protein [Spirochaetales bacterium]